MKTSKPHFLPAVLAFLLFLSSCTNGKTSGDPWTEANADPASASSVPAEVESLPDLPDGAYLTEHEETLISLAENRLYALNPDTGALGWYDLQNGMAYTAFPDMTAEAVYADESGLILYADGKVTALDRDGNPAGEWETDIAEEAYVSVCAGENTILLADYLWNDRWNLFESCITTVDRRTGEISAYPLDEVNLNNFQSIRPDGEDFILTGFLGMSDEMHVCRFRTEKGEMEECFLFDRNNSACDTRDGRVWYLGGRETFHLMEQTAAGDPVARRTLSRYTVFDQVASQCGVEVLPYNFNWLAVTGRDFLIWNGWQHILLINDMYIAGAAEGRTLSVYYPKATLEEYAEVGAPDLDIASFEEEHDCAVEAKYWPRTEYENRLRMKLLAGDKDIDVAYLYGCDEGDLFAAILRYGLYLPLEDYPAVTENFEAFADGVREYMTHDGHLVGIPFAFGASGLLMTTAYAESGLPVPEKNWTIDDFWKLCEAYDALENKAGPLAWANVVLPFVEQQIEQGVRNGKIDRDAILDTMKRSAYWFDRGALAFFDKEETFLLNRLVDIPEVPISPFTGLIIERDAVGVLNPPGLDGVRYVPIQSMTIAVRSTTVPELAAEYMAMLSSPEWMYNATRGRSWVMKDLSGYYRLPDLSEPGAGTNHRPFELTEYYRRIVPQSQELIAGSQIETIDHGEFMEKWELFRQMFEGSLTPEEVADEIVNDANYRYME